jgi:RND family efflux transporter MFP subunit
MMTRRTGLFVVAAVLGLTACSDDADEAELARTASIDGAMFEVRLAPRPSILEAAGVAAPMAEATLSTKLMGTVTAVLVHEGGRVAAGQPLVRIDARDLVAKEAQVAAGRAEATAVLQEAELHAQRMQALHDEDAAPRAQLDAALTGVARARAAVESARAAAAELAAVRDYSVVTAPFAGVVIRRLVDPGSFAAPGAPLLILQDASTLRVSANVTPANARRLEPGMPLTTRIEGESVTGTIEGVVPVPGMSMFTVNVLVPNRDNLHPAGGAAVLEIPGLMRPSLYVHTAALIRRGSLTGVHVRDGVASQLRWVRLGAVVGDSVEVTAGLRDGDTVIVPASTVTAGR